MTTSVRILGSRAREQVPGTSITLLAPGFHGAMTQLAANDAALPLPFEAAAAGAEVMLAAQLSMHIVARPPHLRPGLRSRSAVAKSPRLIVPRRKGVAYALLQTDEEGRSSLLSQDTRNANEAAFPLTIAADGRAERSMCVLMWPEQTITGPGSWAVTSRWERLRRPYQLLQLREDGLWQPPDWATLLHGPMLLLLHGTFGTPQATFSDWLSDESFRAALAAYGGRCLAFAHPTLASTPDENLAWLVAHLPKLVESVDVVAHGRGGLLARSIAIDGRVPLRRVCQIGTPNKGTPLAAERSVARYLDAHISMLAGMPHAVAQAPLEGALSLNRFVALGMPAQLPGVTCMAPDSLLLRALSTCPPGAQQWFTIGAEFHGAQRESSAGGKSDEFDASPNDLVVPSEGCHEPGAPTADSLRLAGSAIHHHNYFSERAVRERLYAWLR